MRTTRQRSKPVNLIVKKTDYGYEVLEDKDSAPILPAKSRKSEKLGSPAKSSVSKSGEKEGDTVSTNTTPVATRPAKTKVQKSNTKNLKQQQQAKSPSVHTESEAAKKEELINTFASPSEPNFTIHQEISKNDVPSAGQERPEKPETTGKSERTERQERVERERPAKMTEPKFSEPKSLDLGSYEHLQVMKKYPVVVPTVGSWFSFDKIDPIEKENLPEFFAGKPSKTPEVYKKYRNFMVNLYRSNPRHYLHATTCRRSLAGDVNGILRIHAFLEQNGLINFSVEPSTLPQHLYLLKPSLELGNRYKVKSREVKNDFVEQEKANAARNSENDLLMTQIRILNKQSRPQCNYCGLMCGIVWYHQKGSASFQQSVYGSDSGSMSGEIMLCLKCFTEGHLPDGIPQSEFHKVNLLDKYNPNFPKNPNPSYWTQEETLRLLDLFQMEKDPWEEIPRYFPYKTKDDIILHWLQLPVKNISLLESLGFNDEDGYDQTTAERVSSLAQGLFDDGFSNPLMSHMGVFKEVLDKYTGGGQDILKEEKKGDEGVIEEKREEGYEGKQMEVEYAKEQKRQDNETMQVEEKGKDNENGLGEGTEPANGRRSDIAIIELGKSNMEKKVVDGRLERMFTIVDKEGEILEDVEKQTKERANILKKKEEEKIRETANILIDLQINKLEAKLSFLEEYEKVLGQEKKQNESFQKMTLAERIYLVQKKLDAAKPPVVQAPAQQAQPQNPFYDSREPGYLNNFYNQMGNVNIDDMLSLGHHDRDDFQTDGF